MRVPLQAPSLPNKLRQYLHNSGSVEIKNTREILEEGLVPDIVRLLQETFMF